MGAWALAQHVPSPAMQLVVFRAPVLLPALFVVLWEDLCGLVLHQQTRGITREPQPPGGEPIIASLIASKPW